MNSKQECIAKAYGEYWEVVKDFVNELGWCYQRRNIGFDKLSKEIMIEFNGYDFRPIILKGLENNNGWIKIESEDDLPEQGGSYYVTRHGKIETAVYVKNNRWLVNGNDYPKTTIRHSITHYQPIEKPKPPLY